MDASLVVLAKLIEDLDPSLLPSAQDTSDQLILKRRSVQNLIYLVQALGDIDLGYRFGWQEGRTLAELKRAFDASCAKDLRDAFGRCQMVVNKLKGRLGEGGAVLEMSMEERDKVVSIYRNVEECLWRLESAAEALEGKR